MALAIDVADVGGAATDQSGTQSTHSFTTTSAVSAGARLLVANCFDTGGATPLYTSITVNVAMTLVVDNQNNTNRVAMGYLDYPSGLAAGAAVCARSRPGPASRPPGVPVRSRMRLALP
jgi:hypothetical protein